MISRYAKRGLVGACLLAILGGCTQPLATSATVAPDAVGLACSAGDPRLLVASLGAETSCSVRLAPGEQAIVAFDPVRDLVVSGSTSLHPGDLVLGASDGSGAVTYPGWQLEPGRLVLPRSGLGERSLLHLRRLPGTGNPITLVVRQGAPLAPEVFRARFFLPGSSIFTDQSSTGGRSEYDLMRANEPVSIRILGPTRLEIRTRPLYSGDPDWQQTYRIEAELNGTPFGVLEYNTTPDLSTFLTEPDAAFGVGSRRTEYLDLPRGQHTLTLIASQQILVQAGRGAPARGFRPRSIWSLPRPLGDFDPLACSAPEELETAARRVARDNERLGGGLVAAAGLARAAASHPDTPDLFGAALGISGQHTFFRDLVAAGPGGLPQQVAYAYTPDLADEVREDRAVSGFSTGMLAARIPSGIFQPVTGPEAPLIFALPERGAQSDLRILVDHGSIGGATDLLVSFDGGVPQPIRLLPDRELEDTAYVPDAGAIGLMRIAETAGVPLSAATQTEEFNVFHATAPLVSTATAQIPLPQGVREVRFWIKSSSAARPRIAVQYRAASTEQLSERSYRGELGRLGRGQARALFGEALTDAISCPGWLHSPETCPRVGRIRVSESIPVRELYNDWIPILRLARAREQALFRSLPPELRTNPPSEAGASPQRIGDLTASAQAASAGERWRDALETWSEVTRVATGAEWARAEIGRADALLALGETFLAERLLRSLYAGAPTGGFRREAYNRLIELYRNDEAPERLVGLHAAELAQNFAPEVFRDFATALMREGQDDMAARLTALLPAGMLGDLKLALFRTGWLDELAERVAFGDFEDRAAWLSLIAAREPADDALSGEADSRTLSASQISSGAEIGSARIWRGAEELIERSAGGVAFQAIAHGGFGQLYQARPDLPVRLAVEGPARLRVSARPVHPGSGDTPIDGWFEISVGGTSIPVPVTSNYGATGIELIGAAGTPGTAIAEVVTVPPGHHHVTIRPETMSLLVGVEIETPALQVPGSVDSLASRYSFGLTPAQRLADLLRTYETSPDDRAEILGRAARLAEGYPLDPDVSSVWRRFARQSGWERIQNVDRSAGLRTVDLKRYLPESPELQARLALLPSFEEGERLLHTTGETALSVTNPEAATIEASLRLQTAPTLPTKPVIVSYRVGDSEPVEIKLTATDPSKQVGIKLPPGEQVVRFSLAERQANQFVRLRLREEDGRVIGAERERTYEVATPEEPVVLTLQGPVWLQIDEYRDGSTVSRTRFVENGLQTIEVAPDPGQSEALLRIFRLEPDDEPVAPVPRLAAPVERAPVIRVAPSDWPACPAF